MCCIHLCSSAALAHVKSLESTTGPESKEEQYKSRSGRHNVHSVISSDSLLISNMCGECGASVSRETTRTESPDRGRMPCGEKTKIKVKHVVLRFRFPITDAEGAGGTERAKKLSHGEDSERRRVLW